MRNNQLTAVLLGLLFLSTLANVWVIYSYNANFRRLQHLQLNMNGLTTVQGLYAESNEYAKTHPDMARLLQTPLAGPAAVKPAASARPAGK